MDKIVTECVYPPIPIRDYDWRAWVVGEEPDAVYYKISGWGRDEKSAIADLKEQLAQQDEG